MKGITTSFWNPPGKDVVLRLQTKMLEISTRANVWLVHFQYNEIYIEVKTKLYWRVILEFRLEISLVTPSHSTMWTYYSDKIAK